MTPREFQAAFRGHLKSEGIDPDAAALEAGMSRNKLAELMKAYPDE